MKKLLTGFIATCLSVACFAGCGGNDEPKKQPTDLEGAKDYLDALYVDKNVSTRVDYEVFNSIVYDGLTYSITWSVDVTEGVTLVSGSETTTVDVDETASVAIPYVLTATIKDVNGDTIQISFNREVKAAPTLVAAPIQSAPEENVAYQLHVYQSSKQLDLYFIGEMNGYYFKTSENVEDAVDIYVEYDADNNTVFYPYFLDSNETKQYVGMKVSEDGKHNNIVYAATRVSPFSWNEELSTITTKILDRDGKETEFYLGNYGTYVTIQGSAVSHASDEGANIAHLIGMVDRTTVPTKDKIAQEAKTVSAPKAFVGNAEYTLDKIGVTFPDVTIAWTVEGSGASVNGNVLTVEAGEDTSTVKLTATLTCDDLQETVEFDVVVIPNDPAKIVAATAALGEGGKIANKVTMTGVVTKINTEYNAEFGNVSFTMDVNGTSVYCFRAIGGGADKIAVGYTVTVEGSVENYKGSAQFGQNSEITSYVLPDEPADSSSDESADNSSSVPADDSSSSVPEDSSSVPADDSSSSVPEDSSSVVEDVDGLQLSLDDKANRTELSDSKQVWEQNGVKLTNEKTSSSNAIADYVPARFYKNSSLTIECTGMKKIVFNCNDYKNTYATDLQASITGANATVTVDGLVVTVEFATAVDSFTIASLAGQVRVNSLVVVTE